MQNARGLVALLISATGGWAQIAGPSLSSVAGAADYGNAASVGIPQGSIFVLTGQSLSTSALVVNGPSFPTNVSGVSVEIWTAEIGGKLAAQAPLLYVSPAQINAILPSSVAAGQYYLHATALTITTNWMPIVVTTGRFAPFTQQGRGFGPATIQQYDAAGTPTLNQFTAPAPPGAIMALWGTGLGALPAGSDAGPAPAGTVRNDVTVYVAGIPVKPLYAGRAPGLSGVDQINFVLPAAAPAGCYVPLQVATGTAVSSTVTVAVSGAGNTCPSEFGLSPNSLTSLDAGGTITADVLSFSSTTSGPGGNVSQTSQAWRSVYDASSLSVLATATYPPLGGSSTCTHSPSPPLPDLKGLRQLAGVPLPYIAGPEGCVWPSGTQVTGTCIASSFSFGSTSGSFPQPRPASTIAAFSAQRSGQLLTFLWNVTANPNDNVNVTAGSHYFDPGIFGADSHYYYNQSSCRVSPAASPFVFPAADYAAAFEYGSLDPSVLTLTDVDYRSYPGSQLTGLVVLLTYNSATATAAIQ
jgi:uncharacterized protein (TIGR03437 family)